VHGPGPIQELIFSYHPNSAEWGVNAHCTTRCALRRRPPGRRVLVGVLASSDGTVTVFVDLGKYQFYNCEQLAGQRTYWTNRELELKLLMDKAEQGTGGTVVNVIAYRTDYVTAREELKVIEATARAKNCDAPRRP
jgi:hypothetical protein